MKPSRTLLLHRAGEREILSVTGIENGSDMPQSDKTIALAGIIATAIVGIVGVGSTWLVSRADRDSQRTLARDARVYERRVAAYLEALSLLQPMERQLGRSTREVTFAGRRRVVGPLEPVLPELKVVDTMLARLQNDDRIRLNLLAFGSRPTFVAYDKARNAAIAALREVYRARDVKAATEVSKALSRFKRDRDDFFKASGRFLDRVHQDIG